MDLDYQSRDLMMSLKHLYKRLGYSNYNTDQGVLALTTDSIPGTRSICAALSGQDELLL